MADVGYFHTVENDIRNTIASAEARLAGLRKLPREEPWIGESGYRCFLVVISDDDEQLRHYTLFRTGKRDDSWYLLGVHTDDNRDVRGPVNWVVVIMWLSRRIVHSWVELAPVAATEPVTESDDASRLTP